MKKFKQLLGDKECDVVIVGGGMAGILSAYTLTKAGKKVILLEKNRLLSGATQYTTAFVTNVIDTDLTDLVDMFGEKKAKLIWGSHAKAIDYIETLVKKEKIDCKFIRCNNYSYANDEKEFEALEEEHRIAKKLGFKTTIQRKNNLNFENSGYLTVKDQAKFLPFEFATGLIESALKDGLEVYEQTEVKSIEKGKPILVRTKRGNISAKYSITATYSPFDKPKEVFAKKGMYVSYVMVANISKGLLPEAIYEDQQNPYHYFRIDPQGRYDQIELGGEDHRKEIKIDPKKNFKALKEYLDQLLVENPYKITKKWAGPILEPTDGIALIGTYKPNQLLCTAFSGNGMTYSAISAMIFRDIILKKQNPWIKIYDPKRHIKLKHLAKKGRDYTEEFLKGAVQNFVKKDK